MCAPVQPPAHLRLTYDGDRHVYAFRSDVVVIDVVSRERQAEQCRALVPAERQAMKEFRNLCLWIIPSAMLIGLGIGALLWFLPSFVTHGGF